MSDQAPEKQWFRNVEINKILTEVEKTAINDLVVQDEDKESFKSALKTEKLGEINKSFLDITNAFIDCNVHRNEQKGKFEYDPNIEPRLQSLVDDPNQKDFAYLIWKVSDLLKITKVEGLEEEKLGIKTEIQLQALKTEIEKTAEKKAVEGKETLAVEDITGKFPLYSGLMPKDIVDAIETLKTKNALLADEIIPLLKEGKVKDVQLKLGMKEGNYPLHEKADNKFGRSTLTNLEAGKVVIPTSGAERSAQATEEKEKTEKMKPILDSATVANRARYLIEYGHKSFRDAYGTKKADGFGSTKIDNYNQADIDRIDRTIVRLINMREGIDRHPADAIKLNLSVLPLEVIIKRLQTMPATVEYRIDFKWPGTNANKYLFFKKDKNVVMEPDNQKYQREINNNDIIIKNDMGSISLRNQQNILLKTLGIDALISKKYLEGIWLNDQKFNSNLLKELYHVERRGTPPEKIMYYPIEGYERLYPNENDNYNTKPIKPSEEDKTTTEGGAHNAGVRSLQQ